MQNITAPSSEASTTYNSYASVDGYKNYRYIFYIPIYENMPTVTYLPNPGNPNNWLSNLTINGATISGFDSAKKQYTVNVSEYTNEVTIDYIKISSYATVSGSGIVALTTPSTDVNVTVTAQNGDKNTYTITINKDSTAGIAVSEILNASGFKSDGTYLSGINVSTTVDDLKSKLLTIAPNASINIKNSSGSEKSGILCTGDTVTITSGSETKTYSVVIYGDVNGDGVLDSTDLLRIRQQLIGSRILSGANYQAANITKDTAVDSTDLLRMRQQLIGVKLITQ